MSLAEAECRIGEADRGLAAAAAELARRQAAIEQARDARDGRQAAALALRRPRRASCAPRWRASALRAPRSGGRGAAGGGAARDGARGGRDAARGARRGRGQRGGGGGGQGARRGAAAARRRARRPARSVGVTRRRPRARRRPCTPLPRQRSAWPRASWPTCGRPPRPSCRLAARGEVLHRGVVREHAIGPAHVHRNSSFSNSDHASFTDHGWEIEITYHIFLPKIPHNAQNFSGGLRPPEPPHFLKRVISDV